MDVLNLYAGLGGNRKYWTNCRITAVEQDERIAEVYSKLFPSDTVIVADAHEYLIKNFERFGFIWSSPPCPTHSRAAKWAKWVDARYPDLGLYQEIIFLQQWHQGKFVVENVVPYYECLVPATKQLSSHLFWSNFSIPEFETPDIERFKDASVQRLKKWLGMDAGEVLFPGEPMRERTVYRNCVHPDLGLHIFNQVQRITGTPLPVQRSLFVTD